MAVLVVTNSDDPTADFVLEKAEEQGVETFRLNTDRTLLDMRHSFEIGSETPLGLFLTEEDGKVSLGDINGVWYRRPVEPEVSPGLSSSQAKKYACDEAYYYLKCLWRMLEDRVWVSYPWAISWANVKLHQIVRAKDLGFGVPETLATNVPTKARLFWERLEGRVVVKPFKVNVLEYGDRTPVVYTSRVNEDDLQRIDDVKYTVTFFQEEVEKELELRVTVIGDQVFCAAIDSQSNPDLALDWRRTSSQVKLWEDYDLPEKTREMCIRLVKEYGLNFGAIDLAVTLEGEIIFFELNPNGQWAWLEIQLGLPMSKCLLDFLEQGSC